MQFSHNHRSQETEKEEEGPRCLWSNLLWLQQNGLLRLWLYQAKKLAAVLTTPMSVTVSLEADANAQAPKALQRVPCIWYPVWFQDDQLIRALINSGSKVNVMTSAYAVELGLTGRKTSVGAQKIDRLPLETHGMASARFSLQDSLGKV